MKQIGRLQPVILGLLSMLCLASMALPAAYAAWYDARLLDVDIARPVEDTQLSEQAQQIPVVYALYRKRYLSGIEMNSSWTTADTTEQADILSQKMEELKNARLLPSQAVQKADQILTAPFVMAYSQQQDGFTGSSCESYSPGQEHSNETARAQWHQKTGLVTSCTVSVKLEQMDVSPLLDRYRVYLGVDVLTDWQTVDTGGSSAVSWSPSGQVYLYYTIRSDSLSFGAVSLSAEEFEASFSDSF